MKSCKCATGYFRVAMLGLAGMVIGSVSAVRAATTNVDIIDYAFSPQNVTINVNDTVHWVWITDLHSSTAGNASGTPPKDTGLWDSGVNDSGYTFNFTFTASGSYPYYCSYHLFPGSVTVKAVAAGPPSISITSPTNGSVYTAPATIALAATASETGGSVASVEFFNGATSLGSVATAPYSETAQNLGAGDYTLSAVATDAVGLKATNSILVHVVAQTLVNLSAPQFTPPGTVQFNYTTTSGLTYVVDRAAVLGVWSPVNTNVASGSSVSFQDSNASGAAQYYRVRQVASP